MAIKGKKRSRKRGSQGARRPAQAPRPEPVRYRKRHAWYKTPLGIGMVAIFSLVAIGLVVWAIAEARENTRELEERQEVLEEYSQQAREALAPAGETVAEMSALTFDEEALEGLAEDAGGWAESLQETQAAVSEISGGEEVQSINELFNEALALYVNAANTFQSIPDIDQNRLQQQLFNQAANVRDTASALYQSAVDVLNQLRNEAELGASGIQAPRPPQTQPELPEDIELPEDDGEIIEIPGDEDGGNG
jgi:CHASE3 domain sensor protein